jgi:sulfate transport system substrate-binding protein
VDFPSSSLGRRLGAAAATAGLVAAGAPAFFTSPTFAGPKAAAGKQEILLVSYAVTKAAYDQIIPLFQADWKKKTGQTVTVKTSYGGSGSQTRAVIDGLEADLVGLALEGDVLKVQEAGLIDKGWQKENPNNSIITNLFWIIYY